jgi:hypothetical protein
MTALGCLRREGSGRDTFNRAGRLVKHTTKLGRVTIAGKPSDEMAPGTLNSVLKQAGLKERT